MRGRKLQPRIKAWTYSYGKSEPKLLLRCLIRTKSNSKKGVAMNVKRAEDNQKVTVAQLAKMLKCTGQTIRNYVRQGVIPSPNEAVFQPQWWAKEHVDSFIRGLKTERPPRLWDPAKLRCGFKPTGGTDK